MPSLQATIAGLNTEVTLLNDNISGLEEDLQGLEDQYRKCSVRFKLGMMNCRKHKRSW